MFTHHCTACERRQLMFFNQVARATEAGTDLQVWFTCWCGAEQTGLLADATATRTRPADRDLVAA